MNTKRTSHPFKPVAAFWMLTLVMQTSCQGPPAHTHLDSDVKHESSLPSPDVVDPVIVKQGLTHDIDGSVYEAEFELKGRLMIQEHARDAARFRRTIDIAYGGRADGAAVESLRARILANDFSWTADVQIVPPETLGANRLAAYARVTKMIYVSSEVVSTPIRTFLYLEEVGHHLEQYLGVEETPGDEGELFGRLVGGEILTNGEIQSIRNDNDIGLISVNGQTLEVEFIFGFLEDLINGTKDVYHWTKNGLVKGGKFIWSGAKTAGDAIGKAANATWDGSKTLGGWVKTGAVWYADTMVGVLERELAVGYQSVLAIKNAMVGTAFELGEGFKQMGDALQLMKEGKFLDGTAAFFVAMASTPLELYEDLAMTVLLDCIGVAQTALFMEPTGRWLTDTEKGYLRTVYGDRNYFPFVRVKEGFSGLLSWVSSRPFTSQFIIYLKDHRPTEDLMVHEMAHVWQYVNGGIDYKSESVHAQIGGWFSGTDPYVWVDDVKAGKGWGALNPEQQARFIENAFTTKCFAQPLNPCLINGDNTVFFQDVANRLGVLPDNRAASFVAGSFQSADFGYESQGWRVDRHPRFLVDTNGDKKLDLVGLADGGIVVSTATGTGFAPGKFAGAYFGADASAGGWSTARHPRLMADMDGDAKSDVVGFSEAGVHIAYSNGSTFESPIFALQYFGADISAGGWTVESHPRTVADVNGDGFRDIVGFGHGGVYVSLAQLGRKFAAPVFTNSFGVSDGWQTALHPRIVQDVNRDGRADIVGFGYFGVTVMLGQRDGTFKPVSTFLTTFGSAASGGSWEARHPRTLADLNGDGAPDIIGFGQYGTIVALGLGDGAFAAPTSWAQQFGADPTAGGWDTTRHLRMVVDVNGDGRADVVGFAEGGVLVARSGGSYFAPTETWSQTFGASPSGGSWSIDMHPRLVGDVTGDGRADVVGLSHYGTSAAFQVVK